MKRRPFLLALAAPALIAGLASGTAAAQTDAPIRIGMTVSSAGTFALAAQSGERGVQIWLDDVNSRGGIEMDEWSVPQIAETMGEDEYASDWLYELRYSLPAILMGADLELSAGGDNQVGTAGTRDEGGLRLDAVRVLQGMRSGEDLDPVAADLLRQRGPLGHRGEDVERCQRRRSQDGKDSADQQFRIYAHRELPGT